MLRHEELTEQILACAFDVHARMGPGLLESTYQSCLQHRMARGGLRVEAEVPIPIEFDEIAIPVAYRADLVVEGLVLMNGIRRYDSCH